MEQRITGPDASLAEAIRRTSALKTINDCYPTSDLTRIKVGKTIRNGERLVCVVKDQDGFDGVEQTNISTSKKRDNGMESNGGWEMDQG